MTLPHVGHNVRNCNQIKPPMLNMAVVNEINVQHYTYMLNVRLQQRRQSKDLQEMRESNDDSMPPNSVDDDNDQCCCSFDVLFQLF